MHVGCLTMNPSRSLLTGRSERTSQFCFARTLMVRAVLQQLLQFHLNGLTLWGVERHARLRRRVSRTTPDEMARMRGCADSTTWQSGNTPGDCTTSSRPCSWGMPLSVDGVVIGPVASASPTRHLNKPLNNNSH